MTISDQTAQEIYNNLTEADIELLNLTSTFQQDLPLYASSLLKVVDKNGNLVDFEFNPLQQELHDKIEQQKRETGSIRVIVLKSRKLGISTYTAARNIHNCVFNPHKRAAVIAHQSDSSNALFRIYKRYYENLPVMFQPPVKTNNSKELEFEKLDSSIKVSTAGSTETGRGDTFFYLHASEIGFWKDAYDIAAGLFQAVPNNPGTEIIIESTPNGINNLFHALWQDAIDGKNTYLPIFFGWNLDPDCSTKCPKDFEILPDEVEYAQLWKLSNEQILWRRNKRSEMGEDNFMRDYPISAAEAFRATTQDAFIDQHLVLKARKSDIKPNEENPLILGVDVARSGKDASVIVWRKGRNIIKYKKYYQLRADELSYKIIEIIQKEKPAKINIDGTGGYGTAVIDFLRDKGYSAEEINFSSKPYIDDKYANRRAEIYGELRDWLRGEVSIPDDDEIEQDLTSFGFKHRGEKLLLESKEDVKKRIKRSPDIGDAIALTFAIPLNNIIGGHNASIWAKINNQQPDYAW